jgi:hypothetical protein
MIAAPASTGVGIQGNPVCLSVTAQPGHSYPLGTVYVVDTGSDGESLSVRATGTLGGQSAPAHSQPFPPSWVSVGYPRHDLFFGSSSVSLPAGGDAYLPVTLNVPGNAQPGLYAGNLVAGIAGTPSAGSGMVAGLGAAAGTGLNFSVGVPAPSCGVTVSSDPALTAAEQAAGDFTAASAKRSVSPDKGYVILAVIVLIVIFLLSRRRRVRN